MDRVKLRTVSILTLLLLAAQGADAIDTTIRSPLDGGAGPLSWLRSPSYRCSDCNVILISIDTLRQDHVGAYGYERETTPNVDEFAVDAIRFDDAIAQAPSTLPSHASIFTSMIPEHHRAFHALNLPLPDEALTMAEVLFDAGFRTAAFTAGAQVNGERNNLAQGFDVYTQYTREETHTTRFWDIVEQGTEWLDEHGDEQFFLFLHTYEVHTPYTPKPEYLEMFDPDYDGDVPDEISLEFVRERINNPVTMRLTEADRRHIVAAYDAEIRSMDDAFGAFVEYLKDNGLYDNTLIVFTSDHGEEFGERGRVGWHSWTLYDELLRVPLLIKLPGSQLASTSVAEVAQGIDLLPTIVDVIGINGEFPFQGASLMDILLQRRSRAVFAVSQIDRAEPVPSSIRTSRWKLIDGALFDLAADPMERVDVSAQYPWVKAAMEVNLATLRSRQRLADGEEVELSEEAIRELRNLGYIR